MINVDEIIPLASFSYIYIYFFLAAEISPHCHPPWETDPSSPSSPSGQVLSGFLYTSVPSQNASFRPWSRSRQVSRAQRVQTFEEMGMGMGGGSWFTHIHIIYIYNYINLYIYIYIDRSSIRIQSILVVFYTACLLRVFQLLKLKTCWVYSLAPHTVASNVQNCQDEWCSMSFRYFQWSRVSGGIRLQRQQGAKCILCISYLYLHPVSWHTWQIFSTSLICTKHTQAVDLVSLQSKKDASCVVKNAYECTE